MAVPVTAKMPEMGERSTLGDCGWGRGECGGDGCNLCVAERIQGGHRGEDVDGGANALRRAIVDISAFELAVTGGTVLRVQGAPIDGESAGESAGWEYCQEQAGEDDLAHKDMKSRHGAFRSKTVLLKLCYLQTLYQSS